MKVKKTFEIETSPAVMKRIERFFALLHHNSNYGHSGLFAMHLDGDGIDKVKITPTPRYAKDVDICGGIGGDVEIACTECYTVKKVSNMGSNWVVKSEPMLFRNGEIYKK